MATEPGIQASLVYHGLDDLLLIKMVDLFRHAILLAKNRYEPNPL